MENGEKKQMGRPKKEKPLTARDLLKLEIAAELGLETKVKEQGWAALTAAESGRIGGLLAKRKKKVGVLPP